MLLFIDTETTGLPDRYLPIDHPSQPHIVQLAAWLGCWEDSELQHVASLNTIIKPEGWSISESALRVHGITDDYARAFGEPLLEVLPRFIRLIDDADELVGGGRLIAHNFRFDNRMLLRSLAHCQIAANRLAVLRPFCTMEALTPRMKLPSRRPGSYKWPTLDEAWQFCFERPAPTEGRHTAMADVLLCKDIFEHGVRQAWWPA